MSLTHSIHRYLNSGSAKDGDSGHAPGGWFYGDKGEATPTDKHVFRCGSCGTALRHDEPAELRHMAREHVAACRGAA
jgi:hypothetical protein